MTRWRDEDVLSCFVTVTSDYVVKPLGQGLINQTFLVENVDNNTDKSANGCFVLQCLNHLVFTQPQNIVDNNILISEHLTQLGREYPLAIMMPKASLSGEFLVVINGEYWRALSYVDNCISPQTIDDNAQAQQAAQTFAQFSKALASLSATSLKPVIDKFHDLPDRLLKFSNAISNADSTRLSHAQSLIKQYQLQANFIQIVNELVLELPQRITHNDTKINNLLFDKNSLQPKAVIDLDTCMSGYLMHDFGDMVRTCCSSISEDDVNIDDMVFKADIFENLLTGYLSGFDGNIEELERNSLLIGARLMPFIIGCRFLTDYLMGDVYFSTSYELHNLDRAANQYKLFQLTSDYITKRAS